MLLALITLEPDSVAVIVFDLIKLAIATAPTVYAESVITTASTIDHARLPVFFI
jgi:hypothetical protein